MMYIVTTWSNNFYPVEEEKALKYIELRKNGLSGVIEVQDGNGITMLESKNISEISPYESWRERYINKMRDQGKYMCKRCYNFDIMGRECGYCNPYLDVLDENKNKVLFDLDKKSKLYLN